MASLLNLNLSSPLQTQGKTLNEEALQRSQLVASLDQSQARFSGLLAQIENDNKETTELLKQLKSNNPSGDQQNTEGLTEANHLETLTKLAHFIRELKKAESLEKLYPKISSLKTEARRVEAEAVKVDTEIKSLKEITAQMRLLLAKKRETTQLIQESKREIADLSSRV